MSAIFGKIVFLFIQILHTLIDSYRFSAHSNPVKMAWVEHETRIFLFRIIRNNWNEHCLCFPLIVRIYFFFSIYIACGWREYSEWKIERKKIALVRIEIIHWLTIIVEWRQLQCCNVYEITNYFWEKKKTKET